MQTDVLLKEKYEKLLPLLDEKDRRLVLAADAKSLGRGGLSKVSSLSGISTASFAVSSIRSWWNEMGKGQFETSKRILITADGGGSNSSRSRLWKKELQLLADDTGMEISVSHFPPGTSKWNKIEHRLFSYISQNWKGQPLISLQLIVDLIESTKTTTGLKVKSGKDEKEYLKGIKVTNKEMQALNLNRSEFHGEWNYKINPKM